MMRALLTGLVWLLVPTFCSAADVPPAPQAPLRVGLLPYVSTQRLLDSYLPLKLYLENTLHRPVTLVTAPNFRSYVERARAHEYDLYLTAPHFAALAEAQFGYKRVSRLLRELDGVIVVRKNGPVRSVADMKGRVMTTPDSLAIITMLGELLLSDNKLVSGKDVTVQYTPSHNNAILAVAGGKADAAVTSAAVFETMPQEVRDQLVILTRTKTVPHMMFMASPEISERDYRALRDAMLRFTAGGAGRAFFERSGYGDMGEITDAQMEQLRPFVTLLQQRSKP